MKKPKIKTITGWVGIVNGKIVCSGYTFNTKKEALEFYEEARKVEIKVID